MPDRIQPRQFSVLSLTGWVLFFSALCWCGSRSDAAVHQDFSFADHHITCTVSAPDANKIPDRVLTAVPLAMKTAIQEIGVPSHPAHLSILLQRSPTTFERLQRLFQPKVFAIQEGDELRIQVPEDPLKLTFRIAHEASHWLVAQQFPARPPLWLDEGLANAVGATAAAAAARAHSQQLERPQPVHLADSAYSLQVLTSLTDYPKRKKQSPLFRYKFPTTWKNNRSHNK